MTSIYDLSWSKTSFLAKLQLFFKSQKRERQKMQSDDRQVQAQGYSALSSAYYSIVGTAFSQLKATLRPKWLVWLCPGSTGGMVSYMASNYRMVLLAHAFSLGSHC